jgi:hypothetical protein
MTNADPRPVSFQHLVTEVAAVVLQRVAPEELGVLAETAREFFDDPQSVLEPRRRDEALGFGIDLALLAPYVLTAGGPVVSYLASVVGDAATGAAADVIKPVIAARVRGLFSRSDAPVVVASEGGALAEQGVLLSSRGGEVAMPGLSSEQARHVRDLVRDRARAIGLPDAQVELLADAFVGSLCSGG